MKIQTTFAASLALAASLHAGFLTTESPYLLSTPSSDFVFDPIVTVGDLLPTTGGVPTTEFAFCGIPDAMGIYKDSVSGENILFCAHEIPSGALSEPFPGQLDYKGAWISRFVLENDGSVASGSVAHKELFLENTFQANTSPLETDTASFTRFCSGAFAGVEHGMDRPLFLTNEESDSGNYSTQGSQTVVVADGKMYTAPDLGRVTRETSIVQPRRDSLTVIVSTEDGPASGNQCSYIYMYVGTKQRRATSVLDKNGLTNGRIYVLCGRDAQHNEGTFTTGSLNVKWVEIPNGATMTSSQLSAAADAAGGFGLIRVEDAEFDPNQPTRSMFVATTGGSLSNKLGRLYELTFNPVTPTANGTLNVVFNADLIATPGGNYVGAQVGRLFTGATPAGSLGDYTGGSVASGVNYVVSIDNIAVSKDFIVACEDTNSPANAIYSQYGRTAGVWTLDRNNGYAAKMQCTFNYAYTETRDGNAAGSTSAGRWEASGVIRTDEIFGPGTFMINVQAHPQTSAYHRSNAPKPGGGFYTKAEALAKFREDGQLLIMRPTPVLAAE